MSNIADATDSRSLSHKFRQKRDVALRDFLLKAREGKQGLVRIADLGGGQGYWERVGLDWLRDNQFKVICINNSEGELVRGGNDDSPIEIALGDATNMHQFADNSFDIVHSNSVIEHVGQWPDMVNFAREARRLAPSYYVQTPYFWFLFDPHFFRVPTIHWWPISIRAKIHKLVKAGWGPKARDTNEAMELAISNIMLDKSQMRALFPDGNLRSERLVFLSKSLIVERLGKENEGAA